MKSKIAWLVPYPIKGSGGHRTIFSHIRNMVERGHENHIFIGEEQQQDMSQGTLQRLMNDYCGPCSAYIHSGYEVNDRFDLAIATAWWTAELVANKVEAEHKLYFVQDFEPYFNPMGDLYIQAENSYRLGLSPITIGRWLSHLLNERYGSSANFFEFTADSKTYFPDESVTKERAVCFIYQPEKPRRCPVIGRDALAIVKEQIPDIKIYTYGSQKKPDYYFDHTHLGILSREECNHLYNKCMVGMCLSSSNPSRVPFEMMAAGLPTVDFYGENTLFDMPEKGILLAERNASSLAGAILKIIESNELQDEMQQKGLCFMKERHSALEFDQCALIIENILAGKSINQHKITPLYETPSFKADFPVPPIPEIPKVVEEKSSLPQSKGLYDRLCNNRIGRVMKVLWRGYY